MELSAYPRHRKRCLSGSGTSFRLFTLNSPSVALAPATLPSVAVAQLAPLQAASKISSVDSKSSLINSLGSFGQLANAICQEAVLQIGDFSVPAETFDASPQSDYRQEVAGKRIQAQLRPSGPNTICAVKSNADGQRVEIYTWGARVTKDDTGNVTEIVSAGGDWIRFRYAADGNLRSFTKLKPTGELHSTGELNGHSVIVRDEQGRVKALGESMSISAGGCLTIHQFDGQFLSTDFVRELHAERRYVESNLNKIFRLTACFAVDGFRLMTNFQAFNCENHHGDDPDSSLWSLSTSQSRHGPVLFRFYGRDGSLLEFNSPEEFAQVAAPARTQAADGAAPGHYASGGQEQTAWHSVNLYAISDWRAC